MLLIGLTGGIGSGKSTVSALLAERGARIIDADAIVHQLQMPGTEVFAAIVDLLGPSVVAADGALDRAAVAALVFGSDPGHAERLVALNGVVHPAVGAEIAGRLSEANQTDDVVILDVPLMVESGRDDHQALLVVDCPVDVAVERLVRHRGMDEADARARIARQTTRQERLDRADFVIDNSGGRHDLPDQVDAAWAWITSLDRDK